MTILFTADLHFTDLPRDEYRWGLLPWLAKQARQQKAKLVVIGGDMTDAKDRHSSALVNRLVRGLVEIAQICPVIIYKGNHDFIDEGEPFFGFTNELNTGHGVTFLVKPMEMDNLLFLPNTKNYQAEWVKYEDAGWDRNDLIFCHATFDGCESESGFKLSGIPPGYFKGAKKVISGDIHKPQMVGRNIEYVGAPYRIRFGDAFVPRVLMIGWTPHGTIQMQDLHYPCQSKHVVDIDHTTPKGAAKQLASITETGGVPICEGDQVKVRVHLKRSAYPEWPAIRAALIEEATATKLQLTGPELVAAEESKPKASKAAAERVEDTSSPLQALATYGEEKAVPQALQDAGTRYLKQAMGG